jgi:putative membrane protein
MGKALVEKDRTDLVTSAKQCLEEMRRQPQFHFKLGFSDLSDAGVSLSSGELGQSGIAVMALVIDDKGYGIGWADSNNMQNNLRDEIVSNTPGLSMLEVCTSDTHSTSGKRTKQGYFALGEIGGADRFVSAFRAVSEKALESAKDHSSFEFGSTSSQIRVMGSQQFEDYSEALDKSMNVTKVFLGITSAVYIAMLVMA